MAAGLPPKSFRLGEGVDEMRIGIIPDYNSQKESKSWFKKQIMKRELKKLGKEIEATRRLLHAKYLGAQDLQDPEVRIVSTTLDVLIVRHQRLSAAIDESI